MSRTVIKKKVEKQELDIVSEYYIADPNKENMNKLVLTAEKLIKYFANLYGSGYTKSDLMQVGTEGLLKAVDRYDSSKGATFSTYAGYCIMGEIRHYVRKEGSFYKPGCITELQYKIDFIIEEILKKTGKTPSNKIIAETLNIKEQSINEIMRAGIVSLDEIEIDKIRSLEYKSFQIPLEEKIVLEQAIKKLSILQRKVIKMLFFKSMTQEETSKKLGINQRKVSRIKKRSLELLKENMAEE